MKVDVHQHLLPRVYTDSLKSIGIEGAGGVPFPGWSANLAVEMMDRQAIGAGIVSISAPGVHFGDDAFARKLASASNDASASLISDAPGRFGSFAILPMPDLDGALAEIEHALDQLRLDGVVLLTSNSDGSYLGDPRLDPVLEELNRRSAVVFVHPTVPVSSNALALSIPGFATEFVFDTSRAIANLIWMGAAERYPDIRFVFSHAGGTAPYLAWRWALLDGSPQAREKAPRGFLHYLRNFYYDTALSGNDFALSALTRLVGSDQILYGSDYPFAPEAVGSASAAGVEGFAGFDADDRARIWRGNAVQLFPRLES